MKNVVILLLIALTGFLYAEYNIGDIVAPSDNISWTDNFGYSSDIFSEVENGKPVMIFFGQTW
jgi:hypothetical protein